MTVAAAMTLSTGCEKLKARDHLNQGVRAFKGAKYAEAVEHFRTAVELDPSYPTTRLYLASAYLQQWIPGADSPENNQYATNAQEQFKKVLDQDPNNAMAIESLASLRYNQATTPNAEERMKRLDEAKTWYTRLTTVAPNKKEAYYSLGVINYLKAYSDDAAARSKLSMKPEDPGPLKDPKVRAELKAKNGAMIEEGLKHLERALQIDPEYDDAMAYLNLIYRQRADLQDTVEAYKADTEKADNWLQKTLETKKIKASRVTPGGGIKAETK